MQYIVLIASFLWQFPELRDLMCLAAALFVLGPLVSVWSSFIPAPSLYKQNRACSIRQISLRRLKKEVKKHPNSWLLYENEIYYIPRRERLNDEGEKILKAALNRWENGSNYAKKIAHRVVLNSSWEGRRYLHYIASHSCPI